MGAWHDLADAEFSVADQTRFKPERGPAGIGVGYNSLLNEYRSPVVLGNVIPEIPQAGQMVMYRIAIVESLTNLRTALNINASASFGPFGGGKMDLVNRSNVSNYSLWILVSVIVRNVTERLEDYKLREEALELVRQKQFDQLFHEFGDSFAAGRVTGGELHSIGEIRVRSATEYSEIKGAASASFLIFSASTDFRRAFESLQSLKTSNFQGIKIGGKGSNAVPVNPTSLIDAAIAFPKEVELEGKPWPIEYKHVPLRTCVNIPPGIAVPDASYALFKLNQLAELRDWATQLKNSLDFIAQEPKYFQIPPGYDPIQEQQKLDVFLPRLMELVRQLRDQPLSPEKVIVPERPSISAPPWKKDYDVPLSVELLPPGGVEHQGDPVKGYEGEWVVCTTTGIRLTMRAPIPQLGIQTKLRFLDNLIKGKIVEGDWVDDGKWTWVHFTLGHLRILPILGITFRLQGDRARYYTLSFHVRVRFPNGTTHDVGPLSTGDWPPVGEVQAVKVLVHYHRD